MCWIYRGHSRSYSTFIIILWYFKWKLLAIQSLQVFLTRDKLDLKVGRPKRSTETKRNPFLSLRPWLSGRVFHKNLQGRVLEDPRIHYRAKRSSRLEVGENTSSKNGQITRPYSQSLGFLRYMLFRLVRTLSQPKRADSSSRDFTPGHMPWKTK